MFSPAVAVAFTVAFVATGCYALARYVRLSSRTGPDPAASGQARAVELLHLTMSVAMIAMAWGVSGGPETGSGLVQIAVFGLFALVFATLAARVRGLARVLPRLVHAAMSAAMVWMVAAMPLLMGHVAPAAGAEGGHSGHAGHGAAAAAPADMAAPIPADAPTWAFGVNAAAAALLVAIAVFWTVRAGRALRAAPADGAADCCADEPAPSVPAAPQPRDAADGSVATLAPAPAPVLSRPSRRPALAGACHAVMSLGMAAMLLVMA